MRSRLIPLVGLSLAAAGVLTAIVFISVGEHTEEPPVEGVETVQRLYGGLEQDGDALGDPDAPVTISIFDDLQCTDCADYYLATVPPLIEDLVRPGDARLEFRHRSLGQKETTLAAFAAAAAGVQDYQWQYIHLVFAKPGPDPRLGGDRRVPGPRRRLDPGAAVRRRAMEGRQRLARGPGRDRLRRPDGARPAAHRGAGGRRRGAERLGRARGLSVAGRDRGRGGRGGIIPRSRGVAQSGSAHRSGR